jgi:thymidylate kinase
LIAFGSQKIQCPGLQPWWNATLRQWALALDIVVWLDASDGDLVERINSRGKRHVVKGIPQPEACEFLARYRSAYEQILGQLTIHGRPTLLRLDTGRAPAEQFVGPILACCQLSRGRRSP